MARCQSADAGRLTKEAKAAIGYRSLWRQLRVRVRPRRQLPDAGAEGRGTSGIPGG
jgi:hypothetical protein